MGNNDGETPLNKLAALNDSQKKSAREKFQRFMKKVANATKSEEVKNKENVGSVFKVTLPGGKELTFDVQKFKPNKVSISGLTNTTRLILVKDPSKRSESELRALAEVVSKLKCFQNYSKTVKMELPKIIYYDSIDAGRRIIQQGHEAKSLYFLVSGSAFVQSESKDSRTGLKQTTLLGEIKEGSSFGEVALIHNVKRTATVICKEHCELLRVDKDDFSILLEKSADTEWSNRLKILQSIPAFSDWTKEELLALNNHCKNIDFPKNKVLVDGTVQNNTDYIYFIISGEISVVREVYIAMRYQGKCKEPIFIRPSPSLVKRMTARRDMYQRRDDLLTPELCSRRFWRICSLGKGLYYGAGENLENTYLITKRRVEVVQIPRSQFIKHGRGRVLERLREDFNELMPSNDVAFDAFLHGMKWEKFKKSVTDEVLKKRLFTSNTTLQDVPLSIQEDCASFVPNLTYSLL